MGSHREPHREQSELQTHKLDKCSEEETHMHIL
jgi:hypothetical protein